MVCLSCRGPGASLCPGCLRTVIPLPPLRTPGGVVVHAWAAHDGAARVLVRRLKYEAVVAVADVVAAALVDRIPSEAGCLVPVPRTYTRRVRYGIDPARELAVALARRSGLPVVAALGPPVWGRPNAGSSRAARTPPRLVLRRRAPSPLLVDDVLTTGATLDRAASVLGGAAAAVTVTGVP